MKALIPLVVEKLVFPTKEILITSSALERKGMGYFPCFGFLGESVQEGCLGRKLEADLRSPTKMAQKSEKDFTHINLYYTRRQRRKQQ